METHRCPPHCYALILQLQSQLKQAEMRLQLVELKAANKADEMQRQLEQCERSLKEVSRICYSGERQHHPRNEGTITGKRKSSNAQIERKWDGEGSITGPAVGRRSWKPLMPKYSAL